MGLVLALSGTAISDIGKKDGLNQVVTANPNALLLGQEQTAGQAQPTFKKPASALIEVQLSGVAPTPPSNYYCEYDAYYDDTATSVYVWTIPDSYGDDLFNTRFTVDEGVICSLKVGWLLMYGGYTAGTPDLRIYLWDDDGFGFPGNKLDSGDVAYADLPGGFGWVSADFTANGNDWVFNELEEYHIGWTVSNQDGTNTAAIVSDKATGSYAGEERNIENYSGSWGSMLNDWGGDYAFFIESERCCYELPFSDCYSQSYDEGVAYVWRAPHDIYDIYDYGERFSVSGPETLQSVDMAIYDFEGASWQNAGIVGNDDIIATVWDVDGGTGMPGTAIAQVTITAGSYPFYPTYTTFDFSSFNLVMTEDFYVTFNSTGDFSAGDYEVLLSDDETTPNGRSVCYYGGDWYTMGDLWGIDVDMKMTANLCIDPYSNCGSYSYFTGLSYYWSLPDAYGDYMNAQRIKAIGEECKVGEVYWMLYNASDAGVDSYLYDSKIAVYSDVAGAPGTELASITVTPAEYVTYPAWQVVDFLPLDVNVTEYYWIAIESQATTTLDIFTLTDNGGGGFSYSAAEYWGSWGYMYDDWSGLGGDDIAFVAGADHCCIPFEERWCGDPAGSIDPGWSTFNHDAARSGASLVPLSDAWCDLTLTWDYQHPSQQSLFTHPVMFDGKLIQSFNNEYRVYYFDGTLAYTISGFPLGDNMRTTPTVVAMDIASTPTNVVFIGGGTQQSVAAYNFDDGSLIWSRDIGTVGPTGLFGNLIYSAMIYVDGVLYWPTDAGSIVAADAETGDLYTGWTTNPVELSGDVGQWGVTDGNNLYFGTYTASNTDGDLFAISCATGDIVWQLSSAGGMQGNTVFPTEAISGEGFNGSGSYENGILYANARIYSGDHPSDGVLYAINVADGSIKYAVASARTIRTSPIIDENTLYIPNYSRWVTPPVGGAIAAHAKNTGSIIWAYKDPDAGGYYSNPVLSCEPDGAPDLLFCGGHTGLFVCLSTDDGDEIYRRRIDYGLPFNSMWNGGCIGPNGEMAFSHYYGGLSFMEKGVDRPRLEIQTYNPAAPVEFGSATSVPVTFDNIITNTGCTDLNISAITTDEFCDNPYTPEFTSVRPDVLDNATTIADRLTNDFAKAPIMREEVNELASVRYDRGERVLNAGTRARPAFVQTATNTEGILAPTLPAVVAPGDSLSITVDINQSLILRGPQYFCMYIDSDDPDFYLNASFGYLELPCIQATIVGGCLIDTTQLSFGLGGANTQTVYNTGRIATGDDWAEPWGFDIDGDAESMFQGSYLYATSTYEIAINTQAWHGEGEESSYVSMQPDPNYFDNDCHAALEIDVALGSYSTDGITYTDITGDMVHKSYLDSVQNFDDGGGWDWTWFEAPFDNSYTMGLYVNTRTTGAYDFEPLKDLTVEIFEITERNGNAVPNWKFGATFDYDLGTDVVGINQDASVVYDYDEGSADVAWGQIKLPFGCASTPTAVLGKAKNARGLHGNGAWWEDIYLDSAYTFMSMPAGATQQDGTTDAECHFTLLEHDFTANETISFAIVNFALHGLADASLPENYTDLGYLCNKWVGFGRGDVNNDGLINLADIVYLNNYVMFGGPGPIPFMHLGDVDGVTGVDGADVAYMLNWYFGNGDCPISDWAF